MKKERLLYILRYLEGNLEELMCEYGLCRGLNIMFLENIITVDEESYLHRYLNGNYPEPAWGVEAYVEEHDFGHGFIWKPGDVKSRRKFLLKLIKKNKPNFLTRFFSDLKIRLTLLR